LRRLLGRLLGGGGSAMEVSLEESISFGEVGDDDGKSGSESEFEGGRMVIAMAICGH
jgi:hypothetical protein